MHAGAASHTALLLLFKLFPTIQKQPLSFDTKAKYIYRSGPQFLPGVTQRIWGINRRGRKQMDGLG